MIDLQRQRVVSTQNQTMNESPSISVSRLSLGTQPDEAKPRDTRTIFEPVKSGLKLVEQKMKSVDSSIFAPLSDAMVDLIGSGGKRVRPALALLAAEFNGSLPDRPEYQAVLAAAASVEMLHTASLVHDDVIDGALLRRGSPTLNAQWNGGSTVLAGNYMFGRAAQLSAETNNMRVINIFTQTLKVMVDGEINQITDRFNFDQPKENYYQRIYAKTASLFCAATEPAAILSGLPENQIQELKDFGYNLGMAFQIVDDILDFTGNEKTLGKPAGSDLRQGTLTVPFFHYLQEQPESTKIVAYLKERQTQSYRQGEAVWFGTVEELVQEVINSSGIEAAREEAYEFLNRAKNNLSLLPNNVFRKSLLDLGDFIVQRTY